MKKLLIASLSLWLFATNSYSQDSTGFQSTLGFRINGVAARQDSTEAFENISDSFVNNGGMVIWMFEDSIHGVVSIDTGSQAVLYLGRITELPDYRKPENDSRLYAFDFSTADGLEHQQGYLLKEKHRKLIEGKISDNVMIFFWGQACQVFYMEGLDGTSASTTQ